MTGGAMLTFLFLVGALALTTGLGGLRRLPLHRHHAVRTERFPSLNGRGDIRLHAVCSCGDARDMAGGRWSHMFCRRRRS